MNKRVHNFAKALGLIVLGAFTGTLEAQSPTDNWGQAGPVYTAGRARNIVVDKADPTGNTLYAGSASSGIFKTTDGGVNWAPVDDQGTVRNISYMAQDANGVIWVTTGEGFLRYGQKLKAQRGTGLYKLIGTTLTKVKDSLDVGAVINRIACHPSDASKMALATNLGILISNDGGQSFSAAPSVTQSANQWFGMDVKFDGNGFLYCTIGNERGTPYQNIDSRIYKSTDASLSNFQNITPSPSIANLPATTKYGRIELAIAPSNNQVIYASAANKNLSTPSVSYPNTPSLAAVFVSYDGGSNWSLVVQGSAQVDPLTFLGFNAFGDYSHALLVNPTNPNQFFFGGYYLYVFSRSGGTDANPSFQWQQLGYPEAPNTPIYLHQNIHDIKIIATPPSNVKFYFVTDAGIYRSIDMTSTSQFIPPSFQPFYKGFVTGQFNSVSIETYPTSANAGTASAGQSITANDGFVGGTGGNGLVYFNGKYPNVNQESVYLSGEVYNTEFSKLLPKAAFTTIGSDGRLFRTSDVRTSVPQVVTVNNYTGTLTQVTPKSETFGNSGFNNVTGTPFRLWENYGQVAKTPDSLVFYNDSLRVFTAFDNTADMITRTTFSFSAGRPNKFALIDSIAVRTATILAPLNPESVGVPFTASDKKDIFIKLANNYSVSPTQTLMVPPISSTFGPMSAAGVTLNSSSFLDEITVTFTAPPLANKGNTTSTIPDPSVYYRVFATVFYKYKAGDSITITDNSISTRTTRVTFTLSTPLRWSKTSTNGPKPYSGETNPVQKRPAPISARLALVYSNAGLTGANQYAVVVSKAPLNLNDPMNFVRVSQSGALTTDATGAPTNSTITIPGKPVLLEWGKGGTELYYATDDYKLYRVSYINTIMDLSASSYYGKLYNDIFKYGTNSPVTTIPNPASPFRTTLLKDFGKPITSISIASNDSTMVVTLDDSNPTNKVWVSSGYIRTSDFSNINFQPKGSSTFPSSKTYCSLIEKDNKKLVFVGTENGLYYTSDITNPTWTSVSSGSSTSKLPNVQIFDIKQQTMKPWECYNSGMIYVATNGRGVWKNSSYYKEQIVSVNEISSPLRENNLALFPNPTNGNVTASFSVGADESVQLQVIDINGRLVKMDDLGKLYAGQAAYTFNTTEFSPGVYIVNISGTAGIKRVAKLIVTN